MALAVMRAAEPVGAVGLAVADMDLHRWMLAGKLFDVLAEGVHPPVVGAVDEPDGAELAGAATRLDDVAGHCDHRRDADPSGDKDHRALALWRQYELAARRHRLDAQAGFPVGVQKTGDQRILVTAPDRQPVVIR